MLTSMPVWMQILLGVIGIFIVISIFVIVGIKLDNKNKKMPKQIIKKEKSPVTSDICANRAIIIFNVFIIVNAIVSVIGTIVCGCLRVWGGMIGCLIDCILGTLVILLFKYCWQSLFLVIKEK